LAEELLVPVDLAARADPPEALELTRCLIRGYGDLMLAWLSLRGGVQALANEGVRLARPL
jgi:hypothetical protein